MEFRSSTLMPIPCGVSIKSNLSKLETQMDILNVIFRRERTSLKPANPDEMPFWSCPQKTVEDRNKDYARKLRNKLASQKCRKRQVDRFNDLVKVGTSAWLQWGSGRINLLSSGSGREKIVDDCRGVFSVNIVFTVAANAGASAFLRVPLHPHALMWSRRKFYEWEGSLLCFH